jgi:hypothetical protein
MSDREHHCPFLNRSDHRCSHFFSMHDMQHAFEHCFDAYQSCGVYRELLAERQARRGQAAAAHATTGGVRFLWATACKMPAAAEAASDVSQTAADPSQRQLPTGHGADPRSQFVQLRVPAAGNLAAAAAISTALALAAH